MHRQAGFSVLELLLAGITFILLVAIVLANFRDAVVHERRAIAQQALLTTAGLQERWFLKLYKYSKRIEDVGGEDAAGEYYILKVTQDPCGDTTCFTVIATARGEQEKDRDCEKMSINHLGIKRASNFHNEDTTAECWGDKV